MSLSVISSGFGRTGTMSLKLALEQLGFGPCHHMEEVMGHPEQVPHWCAAALGETMDWDDVYRGYRSTVDWPGAHYWRELVERYPDAKVIHTVRPAEEWWDSFSKTIGTILADVGGENGEVRSLTEMAHAVVATTFGSGLDDKDAALQAFEQRTADVKAAVPADRLLVFEARQGWAPLCEFLGVPTPTGPFPRTNDTAAFWKTFGDAQ